MTPDLSVFAVIFFVLLCTVLLNSLIFQPILKVMHERERAVVGARELAQSAAQKAASASAEYDQTFNKARVDLYRQMDEKRRAALEKRAHLLAETRGEIEKELAQASGRVKAQSDAARASLDTEARSLADVIVERVLGRA